MKLLPDPPLSPVNIQLDWQAYFKEFCLVHGGNPLVYGGRLLFPDGWMHSSTDYSGPEFPPPEDPNELRRLREWYWRRRRQVVAGEVRHLEWELQTLEGMQAVRQVQLQQAQAVGVDGQGRMVVQRGPLDLGGIRGRLDWLQGDLKQCDRELAELEEGRQVA